MPVDAPDDIVVIAEPIAPEQLRALVERFFGEMVKLVIDVHHELIGRGEAL